MASSAVWYAARAAAHTCTALAGLQGCIIPTLHPTVPMSTATLGEQQQPQCMVDELAGQHSTHGGGHMHDGVARDGAGSGSPHITLAGLQVGISLVGTSSVFGGEGSSTHEVSPKQMLAGMGLIVASQVISC